MKKVVEAVLYDKSGKKVFAYVFKTSTIKKFAGIKRIDELEYDADAQVQLESLIVDATKSFAKKYAETYDIIIDNVIIYNDYADTVEKYSIR